MRPAALIALALALTGCGERGAESGPADIRGHVTFYGVGKVARYQQSSDSSLESMGPLFFAEIFLVPGGEVSAAQVRFPEPVGEVRALSYQHSESEEIGDVMYLSATVDSDEALEQQFPSADYAFSFTTPEGRITDSVVSFAGGAFPPQPVIIFEQDDVRVAFDAVDTNKPLVVTWPPFAEGDADPNGILDDLVFVAMDSCIVEDVVHSGRPFERDDYLKFDAEHYVVPAGTLEPGQTYSMYVEHALLPHTQDDYGVPAFSTFAASTYMDFQTLGETDPAYCNP